jgi:methyl-accepting chemotaxis protein
MEIKRILVRSAGIALVVAGVSGLIFCIVGLIVLGQAQQIVEATVIKNLALVDQALAATAEGLTLAETSLSQSTATIESLAGTSAGVGQAIEGTIPTVETIAQFLGEQLPATLDSTQETLVSAATTAKVVDDALAVITAIPFLGTTRYNPEVPLYLGLEDIASSLDTIPASLKEIQKGLDATSSDLQVLAEDLTAMAGNISQIATSVASAQSVLVQYQDVVADLQALVGSVQEALPNWLRMLRWSLSLVLVWLGIAQLGLMAQGWELVNRSRVRPEPVPQAKDSS